MNPDPSQPQPGEDTRPKAGAQPVPVWMFILLAVLGYWGMQFLDGHAGGFQPKVHQPYRSVAYLDSLQPKSSGDLLYFDGERLYKQVCTQCHQSSGLGNAGQAPPLAGSEWVLAPNPDRLVRIVWNGLTGPMNVKGTVWNLQMSPWGQSLNWTPQDVASVLTYIRGNKNWGNDASPVTPEQAKQILEQFATRTDAWTEPELLRVPDR